MRTELPPRPTDGELAILRVIWQRGPSTVRQILESLPYDPPPVYTTVLKLLQIMTEKGLVERDERQRTHIYRTSLTQEQTQRQLINDLLERAFGGSARQLVMRALASKKASAAELAQIEELLNKIEGKHP
jgi:BlaI family transcriptional regulator, penicillinase repressor